MIKNAKIEYDDKAHTWVLTVLSTRRTYVGSTREKAIESCLKRQKADDTIRIIA